MNLIDGWERFFWIFYEYFSISSISSLSGEAPCSSISRCDILTFAFDREIKTNYSTTQNDDDDVNEQSGFFGDCRGGQIDLVFEEDEAVFFIFFIFIFGANERDVEKKR